MVQNTLRSALMWLFAFMALFRLSYAQTTVNGVRYVKGTDSDGKSILLRDNRKPSLYTGNFGDCMGDSSINVTRFDAAYYKDNMTVQFHLAGNTAVVNEDLMMYIAVYAYGESQFQLVFNPCSANIASLCPMKAGVPIEANGIIPIAPSDVANIPSIALSIPDFEGQAILRIFANSTRQMIGCYSAVITNGATFSHPTAVGIIFGVFTVVAVIASFATAIYGADLPTMRTHYAHSVSILVVFAVFQHIFFTGALSMNWPSVLVAFWSNYAWTGGMIYSKSMQNSINNFIGSNKGNTSAVGAASAGADDKNVGGGYDISKIYRRSMPNSWEPDLRTLRSRALESVIAKRELTNSSDGFSWYGEPVKPGLPLPGNYSGFAGTLGQENIPVSNAFMTGFLWFLILLVIIAGAVVIFKWTLEGMSRTKLIKQDRLAYFRAHWLGYTGLAILRTLFIGFFSMIFLSMFQFTWDGAKGVLAIAAIVFIIFFCGMFGVAGYACYYRLRFGNHVSEPDRINLERSRVLGCIPWYHFSRASNNQDDTEKVYAGSIPFWRISHVDSENRKTIHEDEDYIKKFGWLASRFRRTRWWFFALWLVYEFVRACFYAGASGHPKTQVFGLLVVEIIAFIAIIVIRPFEAQRLNALVVYLLGFSKVSTVALSAAFDVRFNTGRIITAAIGIVVVVIQGILTIFLLIAIAVGAVSSYMSIMRHREDFRPRRWADWRERYYRHMERTEKDVPREPKPAPEPVEEPQEPREPYFAVSTVRRVPKIEDEDQVFLSDIGDPLASANSLSGKGKGPAADGQAIGGTRVRSTSVNSRMSYTSLPRGARVHRASWSSRDFRDYAEGNDNRRRTVSSSAGLVSSPSESARNSGMDFYTASNSRQGSAANLHRMMVGGQETPGSISRVGSPSTSSRPESPLVVSRAASPPVVEGESLSSHPTAAAPMGNLNEEVERGRAATAHQ
ncbi:uncharacterized protein K452DRAFT_238375 [Aplosporella prunicola CBS 121167]|uniref:ML-like domain-containing protein n=1 Tax=Aplosporella prunicola CBS 121167 TaxID=1176127 RepID=A0A6A6AV83_9PEZI|nr:uncharacterized protein K452DRAFT_238375 [Aplosporella prunicola CBS 121167]KAF2135942.1 hypothetical protein K452DRAFT_238375 [Aplosporella prunicola CBS 121167]